MSINKIPWKIVLFGLLFYGGLVYMSIQISKPIRTIVPDGIIKGDTVLITDLNNNILKLKKL